MLAEKRSDIVLTAVVGVLLTLLGSSVAADSSNSTTLPTLSTDQNCPGYANCTGDSCHFTGNFTKNGSNHFFQDSESIISCGEFKVDIKYPVTSQADYNGAYTNNCTAFSSGNTTFTVMEIWITKPKDLDFKTINCTYGSKPCTSKSVNDTMVYLVAGLPDNCTTWVAPTTEPPTTPPPTTPPPTTTTIASTSTANTDNATVPTAGPTTNATSPPTPTPNPGTTSAPETTTKGSAFQARLESTTLGAVIIVFLMHKFLQL